jgi:hypothetical protein
VTDFGIADAIKALSAPRPKEAEAGPVEAGQEISGAEPEATSTVASSEISTSTKVGVTIVNEGMYHKPEDDDQDEAPEGADGGTASTQTKAEIERDRQIAEQLEWEANTPGWTSDEAFAAIGRLECAIQAELGQWPGREHFRARSLFQRLLKDIAEMSHAPLMRFNLRQQQAGEGDQGGPGQ